MLILIFLEDVAEEGDNEHVRNDDCADGQHEPRAATVSRPCPRHAAPPEAKRGQ